MWRYLKAALFARPRIPGLGALPVVFIAAVAAGVLTAVQPYVGLAGLAVIAIFCGVLASNQRFRDVVDANRAARKFEGSTGSPVAESRSRLAAQLRTEGRTRLAALDAKCRKILELHRAAMSGGGGDAILLQSTKDALDRLQWAHLRLLLGSQMIAAQDAAVDREAVAKEIEELERLGRDPSASQTLIESRAATLALLRQRLDAHAGQEGTLAEIQSDLKRVEAQVDVALDDASRRATPSVVSANVDLAIRMLDPSVFGAASSTVAEIDQAMATGDTVQRQTEPPPAR